MLAVQNRVRAEAIPFPVAGLLVDVPAGEHWEVASEPAPEPGLDGAVDRVALPATSASGAASYRVRVGHRLAPPCGLSTIATRKVGDDVWLVDDAQAEACWAGPDARIAVLWPPGPAHAPPPDVLLAALTSAVRARRIVSPPARLPAPNPAPTLTLDRARLRLASPADGFGWRTPLDADSPTHRTFDVLVRVVPAYPEAQVQIRSHAGETCVARARRMEAGPWTHDGDSYVQRVGGFLARARCRDRADGALDVRLLLAPGGDERDFAPLIEAIFAAESTGPAPRAAPGEPSVSALVATLGLEAGGSQDGFDAALATDLVWTSANGPFLRWSSRLGTYRSFEGALGVGLRLPHGAYLAVTLGARFDELPILRNTSLAGGLEFHTDLLSADSFAWSLRLVPFQLASSLPAVTGVPLLVAWQGSWPSGLTLGVTLRWAGTPTHRSEDWPDSGVMLGATIGWGLLVR